MLLQEEQQSSLEFSILSQQQTVRSMPPQSRGHKRLGNHSKSTPNLSSITAGASDDDIAYLPTPPHTYDDDGADTPRSNSQSTTATNPPRDDSKPNSPSPVLVNAETTDDEGGQDSDDHLSLPRHTSTAVSTATHSHSNSTSSTGTTSSNAATRRRPPPPVEPRRSTTSPAGLRPFYLQPSRSHSYLGSPPPAAFAPPYYNRPPTPLPPSPSLTSLLRPPFSAHPSRPTTPDSSDTEATGVTTTTSDAGNLATSARAVAGPVPRASPKVPTYEYYGFVLYLGSSVAFLMYLLWSYLPTPFLHQLGIYYYPNRWWSLAVPSWLTMLVIYIYIALACYNTGSLTLPMNSIENFVDEKGDVAIIDSQGKIIRKDKSSRFKAKGGITGGSMIDHRSKGRQRGPASRNVSGNSGLGAGRSIGVRGDMIKELDWKGVWNEGTDAVMDVPLSGVCEILYGAGRELEEDERYESELEEAMSTMSESFSVTSPIELDSPTY